MRERRAGRHLNPLAYAVAPAIGAGVDVYLLANLDGKAPTLGMLWLALGVAYLAYLTRMFRVPPPEMAFSDDTPDTETAAPAH